MILLRHGGFTQNLPFADQTNGVGTPLEQILERSPAQRFRPLRKSCRIDQQLLPFRAAYRLGEYSLTPEVTNAAFERYLEFSTRKGIRPRLR